MDRQRDIDALLAQIQATQRVPASNYVRKRERLASLYRALFELQRRAA
jgi:hypothetical protein